VSGRYAQTTTVDPTASRAEIERLLRRYGATAFASSWDDDTNVAVIGFKMRGRGVRFTLPLPKRTEFARTPVQGRVRTIAATNEAWEQAIRQRWRALVLLVKAKLEGIESGIVSFDEEFLGNVVNPETGQTYGEALLPQLRAGYQRAALPPARQERA